MQHVLSNITNFLFPAERRCASPMRIAVWAVLGIAALASMLVRVSTNAEGVLCWGHCGKVAAAAFFLVAVVCFARFAVCRQGAKGWFIALGVVISLLNVVGQSLDEANSLALFYSSAFNAAVFAFRILGGALFFYALFCLLADVVLLVREHQEFTSGSGMVGVGAGAGAGAETATLTVACTDAAGTPTGTGAAAGAGEADTRGTAAGAAAAAGVDASVPAESATPAKPAASGAANPVLFGREITLPIQLAVIAVCWLPYIAVFFPGSMPTDTARQLAQWFGTGGVPLDNHFPFFTTVLYGLVYSLGNAIESSGVGGMLALTVLQYALGLVAFGLVLAALCRAGAPKWVQVCSVAFVALLPIIPTYMVSISKDYLHALCVAVFCAQLLLLVLSHKRGQKQGGLASWWAIGLVALLVCFTRNNGVVVAGVGLLAAAIALRSLKGAGCLAAVAVVFVCWNSAVLPACGVQPTESREVLSMPAQVVAHSYAMGYEPSAADAAVLAECTSCNLQELASLYTPRISDPAKGAVDIEKSQMLQYVGASLVVAAEHPGSALAAALSTTYGFWYPGCLGTYWSEDTPYYSWDSWSLIDSGWFAGAGWTTEWNDSHAFPCKVLHAIHKLIPGVSHLYRPGTYCWLILFVLAFALQFKVNRKEAAVVLLPLLGLFATLVAGPCASLRYTLPFIFSLPVIMAVLFCRADCQARGVLTARKREGMRAFYAAPPNGDNLIS